MPMFKMTWVFNWGRAGWSESWYVEQDDIVSALFIAKGQLAGLRKKLLGKGAILETAIVSDVAVDGDSLTEEIPLLGDFKAADLDADTPWNAMYCRCEAANRARRQMWLRGIPDSWIVIDPVTKKNQPIALLQTNFDEFKKGATGLYAKLKIRTYDRATVGTSGLPTTGLVADPAGWTRVLVTGFPGAVGEKVGMRKWKGDDAKLLNKTFNVVKVDPTGIVISLVWAQLVGPETNYGGRVYPKKVIYSDITRMNITRLARRKTGRAFFAPAGRQRVRKS